MLPPNLLYLVLLASTKNKAPAGINKSEPITPKAYDQLRSLCCQWGIQSRLSPFAPNMQTEMNPQNPANAKIDPLLNKRSKYLSWSRLQKQYIHVRKAPTSTKVWQRVKKNWVAIKKPGRRKSNMM